MMYRLGLKLPNRSTDDVAFEKSVTELVFDEFERYAASYRELFTEDVEWKLIAHNIIDGMVANERNVYVHQINQKKKSMPPSSFLSTISTTKNKISMKDADQLTADTLKICDESLFMFKVAVETLLIRKNGKSIEDFNDAKIKEVTDSNQERLTGEDLRVFYAESVFLKAAIISKHTDHVINVQAKLKDLYQTTVTEIASARQTAEEAAADVKVSLEKNWSNLEAKLMELNAGI